MTHNQITALGLVAVIAMIVCYELERKNTWFILGFACSCWIGSFYGFMQGAWPFGAAEVFWGGIAFRKWLILHKRKMKRKGKHKT